MSSPSLPMLPQWLKLAFGVTYREPTGFSGGFIPSVHGTFSTSRCAPAARGGAKIPIPHTMLCRTSLITATQRIDWQYFSYFLCWRTSPTTYHIWGGHRGGQWAFRGGPGHPRPPPRIATAPATTDTPWPTPLRNGTCRSQHGIWHQHISRSR